MNSHETCGPLPETALRLPYHPAAPVLVDYGIATERLIAGQVFRLAVEDAWVHKGARIFGYRLLTQDELDESSVPTSQR